MSVAPSSAIDDRNAAFQYWLQASWRVLYLANLLPQNILILTSLLCVLHTYKVSWDLWDTVSIHRASLKLFSLPSSDRDSLFTSSVPPIPRILGFLSLLTRRASPYRSCNFNTLLGLTLCRSTLAPAWLELCQHKSRMLWYSQMHRHPHHFQWVSICSCYLGCVNLSIYVFNSLTVSIKVV